MGVDEGLGRMGLGSQYLAKVQISSQKYKVPWYKPFNISTHNLYKDLHNVCIEFTKQFIFFLLLKSALKCSLIQQNTFAQGN